MFQGHALERWANYRRITREQAWRCDNYNDIEMLASPGIRLSWECLGELRRGGADSLADDAQRASA